MSKSLCPYDPTLRGLISETEKDWGNPADNVAGLVFYGIPPVDKALFGIDFRAGELIGIQAQEKRRKSTMLANIAYNIAAIKRFWVCIDTLESGMPPMAYRDVLVAMLTTRELISTVHGKDRMQWPNVEAIFSGPSLHDELGISKEFLWYAKRSEKQHRAIEAAKIRLSDIPIMLFGPRTEQGSAKNLGAAMDRWSRLYNGDYPGSEGLFARLFCSDHIQQYEGWPGDDYRRLETVTDHFAKFVTSHPGSVVIAVSQVSVTSVRFARQKMGKAQAKGGAKLGAEVNVLFQTDYDKDSSPHQMSIEVVETRRRPPPRVIQEIDPSSGAFLKPAYPAKSY